MLLGKVIYVFNGTKNPTVGIVSKEHDNGLVDATMLSGGFATHHANLIRGTEEGQFSDDLEEVYSIVGNPAVDANKLFADTEKKREEESKAKAKAAKTKEEKEAAKQAKIDAKNAELTDQGLSEKDQVLGREGGE